MKNNKDIGVKADQNKFRPSLLPIGALEEVIAVLDFGANKYSPDNWKKVPEAEKRYTDAMMRHMLTHVKGEYIDDESGYAHLAHAVCCALFILELNLCSNNKD